MESRFCPQCGASVRLVEEDEFTACDFCGSSLHLGGDEGVAHELLRPELPVGEIAVHLGKWLEARETLGRPSITGSRLVFLPFWAVSERGSTRLVPAAPPLASRLPAQFGIPAGDLRRFHRDAVADGEVVECAVPLQSVVDVEDPTRPPDGARLLHLPFWETRYRVNAAEHLALVDAVGGTVLALTWPAASGERWLDLLHAAVMLALLVVVFRAFREITVFGSLRAPKAWHLLAAGPVAWGTLWLASRLRLLLRGRS